MHRSAPKAARCLFGSRIAMRSPALPLRKSWGTRRTARFASARSQAETASRTQPSRSLRSSGVRPARFNASTTPPASLRAMTQAALALALSATSSGSSRKGHIGHQFGGFLRHRPEAIQRGGIADEEMRPLQPLEPLCRLFGAARRKLKPARPSSTRHRSPVRGNSAAVYPCDRRHPPRRPEEAHVAARRASGDNRKSMFSATCGATAVRRGCASRPARPGHGDNRRGAVRSRTCFAAASSMA